MVKKDFLPLLGQNDLKKEISLVVYVGHLLKRLEGDVAGPVLLYLWREFAWENSGPIKEFKIEPETVMATQKKVVDALQKLAEG